MAARSERARRHEWCLFRGYSEGLRGFFLRSFHDSMKRPPNQPLLRLTSATSQVVVVAVSPGQPLASSTGVLHRFMWKDTDVHLSCPCLCHVM